jgi:hypothetical protein
MPLTAITTAVGSLTMLGCWLLVSRRLAHSTTAPSRQVQLLNQFFLAISPFFLIMFLPNLALNYDPDGFPMYMAWGYIIGHVFFYVSLTILLQLMFSMVPRLVNKQNLAIAIGVILGTVVTILNTITMAFGKQPHYDSVHSIIQFNAHPAVGAGIAIFAVIAIIPTAILLIINGVRNPAARTRSLLLGTGFLLMATAGPLHDNAHNVQQYMAADILSTAALLIVAGGVLYRLEDRLAPAGNPAITAPTTTAIK